jgi:hypothetical protein
MRRYPASFGLTRAEDRLGRETAPRPSAVRDGESTSYFRQYYADIPVRGHGYVVYEEGDVFRLAVGRAAADIDLDVRKPLGQNQALEFGLAQLRIDARPWDVSGPFLAPTGQLEIVKRADAFHLVWRFDTTRSGLSRRSIDVDARSGKLLQTTPLALAYPCPDFDPSTASYVEDVRLLTDTLRQGEGNQVEVGHWFDGADRPAPGLASRVGRVYRRRS